MSQSLVVLDESQAADMLTEGTILWQRDIGSAIVTKLERRESDTVVLHQDVTGTCYFIPI